MLARLTSVLLAVAALSAGIAGSAGAATITEFPLPANARPFYLVASPSGTFWYTDLANGVVGGVNSEGTSIASLKDVVPAGDIAVDAKGVIYWTGQTKGGTIARRQLNGSVTTDSFGNVREAFAIGITAGGGERLGGQNLMSPAYEICEKTGNTISCVSSYETEITDLSPGPGGVLWAMEPYSDLVHRLASPEEIASALAVNLPPGTMGKRGVLGPDGNLWVLGEGSSEAQNRLVRIGFDGQQTSFLIPAGRQPQDITVGADGALWFSEFATGSIGRMTTSGEYSSCLVPSAASKPHPYGIATGTDGNIWFTEREGSKIGRLVGNCVPVEVPKPVVSGAAGPPPAAVGALPLLSQLKVTPAAFRAAPAGPSLGKGRGGSGATISFRLDVAADVSFAVQRKASGRRVGGKCGAPSGSNRGKPRCPRFLSVGGFGSAGKAGLNSLGFSGRVGVELWRREATAWWRPRRTRAAGPRLRRRRASRSSPAADDHGDARIRRRVMAVKLHRCSLMFVKGDFHPCSKVQKALDEQGIEYEVVKGPLLPGRRKDLESLSGQNKYPVIEFEDGTVYREESSDMAAKIRAGELRA